MNNKIAAIILILSLCISNMIYASFSEEEVIPAEALESYLNCYALNSPLKSECVNKLNLKYIPKDNQQDSKFVKEFQYKAEKMGFKKFLNNLNLPCDHIDEGPLFDEQEEAYTIKCTPNYNYFMSFNYEEMKWTVVPRK